MNLFNKALLVGLIAASCPAKANILALRRSVFKIAVTSREPNYSSPWKYQPSSQSSGTGFYIGQNRVLTNAHVVASATFITMQRDGDARQQPAFVEFIAHDSDLAILTTRDTNYFKEVSPLNFGSVPRLQSPVSTVGYPMGGEQLSITEGVVSRIAFRPYVHTGIHEHLMIQVSSPINPGNSGGPVFQGRQVVGVAFQTFLRAQSTGYIIPVPIIQRFLIDIESGKYRGHPFLGISYSPWHMTNPAAAIFYGLSEGEQKGVVVSSVVSNGAASQIIRPGDILLSIAGQEIGVDGKVMFENERVDFESLFDLRQVGDKVKFEILRDRAKQEVIVPVQAPKERIVRGNTFARHPRFLVFGGLVFTALTMDYLELWGHDWYLSAPVHLRFLQSFAASDTRFSGNKDLIVLTERLANPVNHQIENISSDQILKSVNQKEIKSLEQLWNFVQTTEDPFVRFDFYFGADSLVLPTEKARLAANEIKRAYKVIPDFWFDDESTDGAIGGDAKTK